MQALRYRGHQDEDALIPAYLPKYRVNPPPQVQLAVYAGTTKSPRSQGGNAARAQHD
jgi:hypothetical protein